MTEIVPFSVMRNAGDYWRVGSITVLCHATVPTHHAKYVVTSARADAPVITRVRWCIVTPVPAHLASRL